MYTGTIQNENPNYILESQKQNKNSWTLSPFKTIAENHWKSEDTKIFQISSPTALSPLLSFNTLQLLAFYSVTTSQICRHSLGSMNWIISSIYLNVRNNTFHTNKAFNILAWILSPYSEIRPINIAVLNTIQV